MSDAIVEIRDYTFEAETFDAYKIWAEEKAVPWLKANLNVIDFWVDCGIEAEVSAPIRNCRPMVNPTSHGLFAGTASKIGARTLPESWALPSGNPFGPNTQTRKAIYT